MIGGDVPDGCTLTVIFSAHRSGAMPVPRAMLSEVFPGARVEDWSPFGAKMKRRNESKHRPVLVAAIEALLSDRPSASFELGELIPAGLAEGERKRLHNSYSHTMQHGGVGEALAARGLTLTKAKDKRKLATGQVVPFVRWTVTRPDGRDHIK
jgi:hypothetical protein